MLASSYPVTIPVGGIQLSADLAIPARAGGLVVFAHGSGSSRFSPRNRSVARALRKHGLATLLLDLLTLDEERAEASKETLRSDMDFLAERLIGATEWIHAYSQVARHPIGYFGASSGAAAALIAAARRPEMIGAIVARGGRADLAGPMLAKVRAPTLLVIGSEDGHVLALNRDAASRMTAPVQIEIVEGASHLFEEAGALEQVGELAARWFLAHLRPLAWTQLRDREMPRRNGSASASDS
ncbi:MAG TPA: alpha/beta family hydrolase [Kofleriaceae bacterium]|nr:alpha/beta family hydrolase [Kofleriaceae bacterium]